MGRPQVRGRDLTRGGRVSRLSGFSGIARPTTASSTHPRSEPLNSDAGLRACPMVALRECSRRGAACEIAFWCAGLNRHERVEPVLDQPQGAGVGYAMLPELELEVVIMIDVATEEMPVSDRNF